MAAWTKAQLRDRILQRLGVLASGQAATPEDATLAEDTIDSVHNELRKLGLVPFLTSAVPDWAKMPLRDIVARDLVGEFGVTGERLGEIVAGEALGRRRLHEQMAKDRPPVRTQAEYF